MFLFCHRSPCSFLQHTTGWRCKQILAKFFKLNKDTPRSLLWVSETFWSICVSVWEIGLHEKPLGLIAVGFDLGRCGHCAGECWESGSYRQEKVTEALQAALWQAWWDDWGDFWVIAAPNSWTNYWACSAGNVTKRPGGHLSLSATLSHCAQMDMCLQISACGNIH
jgi:hypothetical protein